MHSVHVCRRPETQPSSGRGPQFVCDRPARELATPHVNHFPLGPPLGRRVRSRGAADAANFRSVDGRQVATVQETADGRRTESEYRVSPIRNRCTVCNVGVGPEPNRHQEGPTISVRPSRQGAHHPPVQLLPVGPGPARIARDVLTKSLTHAPRATRNGTRYCYICCKQMA